jgi:transcriptional regulator with XRE-family HTH domain
MLRGNYYYLSIMENMGFKENLKSELIYKDMLVKELAARSNINKRTIDNYLRENASIPSADVAVAIAQALGVTVEYLVTGEERDKQDSPSLSSEPKLMFRILETLNKRDRKTVFSLIKVLREQEDSEKTARIGDRSS